MKKVTKNARIADLESKLTVMQTQINSLIECGHNHTRRLIALEPDNPFHGKFFEPEPKLKQLDQSVFDGLDENWQWSGVQKNGIKVYFTVKPHHYMVAAGLFSSTGEEMITDHKRYDASNWQDSLIKRESVELTGSDLARAMLARGDKYVMCKVSTVGEGEAMEVKNPQVIQHCDWEFFYTPCKVRYAVPINNQGEPLTAAEAGL